MRHFKKALILFLALTFMCDQSFASIGVKVNGKDAGAAIGINFTGAAGTTVTNTYGYANVPILSSTLVETGVGGSSGTSMATGTNAVPLGFAFVKKAFSAAGGTTGTIAVGGAGQMITILITSASGTWTLSPTGSPSSYGWSSIAFNQNGQYVTLLYVGTLGWTIVGIGNYGNVAGGGTTLPTVSDVGGV